MQRQNLGADLEKESRGKAALSTTPRSALLALAAEFVQKDSSAEVAGVHARLTEMSVRLAAARRLALSAPPLSSTSPCFAAARPSAVADGAALCASIQRRSAWTNPFKWKRGSSASDTPRQGPDLDDPKKRQEFLSENLHGSAKDSIFEDEIEGAAPPPSEAGPQKAVPQKAKAKLEKPRHEMLMVTDPDPRGRIRWHRKKVIQMVRNNGLLSREERIKMSERELLHKSHFLPTSIKKLVMLSRQIAGKSIDDAIAQMKWSKKKMSAEIKYYLEEARDLAVAQRGMGLGKANGEILQQPRKIRTRDGKWMEITDPTRIYIAQSWVGRGPWRSKEIEYKGRGRIGITQHPSTSFSILLKEEKTRIREYEEDEAKKAAKGPWVHLPDRPIHGQRPYYTW
ncbi:hypothetical protein HIM_08145 [Hirsutella minnesotensis 3608]|uniref:Mitochondrial large ribosomal subunit n=1 Tax=Hirsutella minnesotensis 3608 TaxID=1043627 RepID=A0A0F7ZHE0_9HYPO|nr:hypothetical protein HIM_08145 [Hirsutella minnesotensis 3608]